MERNTELLKFTDQTRKHGLPLSHKKLQCTFFVI